jgi:hypothetical protein
VCVWDGWLRDLASEPAPRDPRPCIRWDDRLLAVRVRFLGVQAEFGDMKVPNQEAAERTRQAIDGALKDVASLGA